jgi:hypothetical protein
MTSTRLVEDFAEVIPNHAPFYSPGGDGYRHWNWKTSPGGNYVVATTACDLVRWAQAHGDPASEVSRAVSRLLEGAAPLPGRTGHYAVGYTLAEVAGTRVVRHEGVLEVNYLTRIPSSGASVITFTNGYYDPAENRAIVEFLLGVRREQRPLPSPAEIVAIEDLHRYAGRFESSDIASWESRTLARHLIRISSSADGLELDWPSWGRFKLAPLGGGSFSARTGPATKECCSISSSRAAKVR